MQHGKDKKYFSKTQIYERLFSFFMIKCLLLELDHPEIVLVVDDDTVGFEFAGLAGAFP